MLAEEVKQLLLESMFCQFALWDILKFSFSKYFGINVFGNLKLLCRRNYSL